MSRKRVPLNQNECTADFRIGVPFEQNLQEAAYNAYEKLLTEGEYVKYKDTLPESKKTPCSDQK